MPPDPRVPTTSVLQYNNIITLIVGPTKEEFIVHVSALEKSHFFKVALKREWQGGRLELPLPDDNADLVRAYVHFLYSGKIASLAAKGDATISLRNEHTKETTLLAHLYVLGERYQDSTFKNAVIDAIMAKGVHQRDEKNTWYLTGPEVDVIYRGTCSGPPARKLMVDTHIAYGCTDWVTDEEEEHNKEFLQDLCAKLLTLGSRYAFDVKSNCAYHEHEDGQRCPRS